MQVQMAGELLKILNDVVTSLPKLALASLVLIVALVIVRMINRFIKWLVRTGNLEDYLREIFPEGMRVPLATLSIMIADSLILIAAASAVLRIFVPEGTRLYSEASGYLARVGSIVVLASMSVVLIDALVKSMKFEKKTEMFFVMLVSLVIAILIIDLTTLSVEIKSALSTGLAIGLGLLIGVFSAWAFFGEYLGNRSNRS